VLEINTTETHRKEHHRAMPQSRVTEQPSQPELQRTMLWSTRSVSIASLMSLTLHNLKLSRMHDDDYLLDDGEMVRNCSSTAFGKYVVLVVASHHKKQVQTSWNTYRLHIVQACDRIDYLLLTNMYNIIYNMPITYTNIMECGKYEKDAFKHFLLVDLD
jgi:hypothetical protein